MKAAARGISRPIPDRLNLPYFFARYEKRLLFLIFLSALLIRLPFLTRDFNITADLPILRDWARTLQESGLVSFYDTVGIRAYPPLSIYLIAAAGWVAEKLLVSPDNNQALLNALIKLPALAADLAAAALMVWLLSGRTAAWRVLTALLYLFNPAVWYISTHWGQTDSIYVLLMVAALAFLARGAVLPAWVVYTLSLGIKLQGLSLFPLLLAWSFRQHGWQGMIKGGLAGGLTALLLALPWLANGRLPQLISATTSLSSRVVQSAYNGWYLLFSEQAATINAALMPAHLPISYGLISRALFGGTAIFIMSLILLRPHRISMPLAAAVLSLAAFTFLTDMRERYLFPVFPFLLLAAAGWPENPPRPTLLWLYLLLTTTWLFNLVTIASFAPAWWTNLVAWQPPYPAHIAILKSTAVLIAAFHTLIFIWLVQYLIGRDRE